MIFVSDTWVYTRFTRGSQEVHKRCTRGVQEAHKRCTRGSKEARQIDITTGLNYTAIILSFPLKDSSLMLTIRGWVSVEKELLKDDKEQFG